MICVYFNNCENPLFIFLPYGFVEVAHLQSPPLVKGQDDGPFGVLLTSRPSASALSFEPEGLQSETLREICGDIYSASKSLETPKP